MKKAIFIIIIIGLAGTAWFYKNRSYEVIEIDLPEAKKYEDFQPVNVQAEDDSSPTEVAGLSISEATATSGYIESQPMPEPDKVSVNLDIPFTSQAPTENWDQPFQDACEEASLLMVDYYYQNKALPDKAAIEEILVDMVDWQEDNWSGHFNLPIVQVAEFAANTYDYRLEVVEDLTADKVRVFLDQGIPIIIPADGHTLANPFFSNDGPDYHMLVIKGYSDNLLITNDPGTKRGADFIYTDESLFASISDWDAKKNQVSGSKVGLVLYKN